MGIDLQILKGTSRDFPLTAMTPEGVAIAEDLTAAAAPTAIVWPGGDRPATFEPSASWVSAAAGTFKVSLADADTADIDPATYYLQAWAVVSGRTLSLLPDGTTLEVLPTPGASVKRPSYITLADVRAIAPWIDDLQVPDSYAGFDRQLSDSRDWLDECIKANYRGQSGGSTLGAHGDALDAWNSGGGGEDRWIKDQLAANRLLVSPQIRDICAYYAIYRICETLITHTGGHYLAMGARARREAENRLATATAYIDLDGDGYGEIGVNFSSTNTLWA